MINHVAGIGHKIKDGFNYVVNYEAQLLNAQQKSRAQDKAAVHHAANQSAEISDNHHYQRAYETMKTKYPALAQYDDFNAT